MPSSSNSPFIFDPHLDEDTMLLGHFALSRVLLMNDARYPWLILVPEKPDLAEIIDLSEHDQMQLMREIATASQALKALFNPDKLNVAALGNRVRSAAGNEERANRRMEQNNSSGKREYLYQWPRVQPIIAKDNRHE